VEGNAFRKKRLLVCAFPFICVCFYACVSKQAPADGFLPDRVRAVLRARIEGGQPTAGLCSESQVIRFYEARAFAPAWVGEKGPTSSAHALRRAIAASDRDGLTPADYHLPELDRLLASADGGAADADQLATLDLLLTDAFITYGLNLSAGRVDPHRIRAAWFSRLDRPDVVGALEGALASGRVEETLAGLAPPHPGYARLRDALARYRAVVREGGWREVPGGRKLVRGMSGKEVAALRARLAAEGYLPRQGAAADHFDAELEGALRRFQRAYGLVPDGEAGPETLAAMNVPADARLRRIAVNLERWRWLPRDLGPHHILVDVAGFRLEVVENGRTVLGMRVVVGRHTRSTPSFNGEMTHLILNPYWHVPRSIAVKDKLPVIQKDPHYLEKEGMVLFRKERGTIHRVDPGTVNWSAVTPASFDYSIRQEPGPKNALGRVKFMLPNPWDVYLHDTPSQELFTKRARAFSSGCIRIAKPMDLAEHLLREDPRWPREKILAAVDEGKTRVIYLRRPVPVYLLYWTAWAKENGTVEFRRDLYGRDPVVDHELCAACL
jgi:murein L,D-transpeptidase YcbB/YkuD